VRPGPDPADARLWAIVAATVRPLAGRASAAPPIPAPPAMAEVPETGPSPRGQKGLSPLAPPGKPRTPAVAPPVAPLAIEPGRHRRLTRERDVITARIDLHGLNQDRARQVLTAFILGAHADGRRQLLVITGKGALGDGVLRRRVPEWLGQAPLRPVVAGLSEAHRRHGGEGALYVVLKR
jgi:DNA-nicking Smr family endonuclease